MNIRFHEQLYSDGISERKLASIQKKIKKWVPKLDVFLVVLPLGNEGLLEIYWYPELLQPYYRKMDQDVIVVGICKKRDDAITLIEQMLLDSGICNGNILLKNYFGEIE